MRIPIHEDRIWRGGCDQRERDIFDQLRRDNPRALVRLVDCIWPMDVESGRDIITDSWLYSPRPQIRCIVPEFWHIYVCDRLVDNADIVHDFSCVMNRASGERLQMFFRLAKRGWIDRGSISFNCGPHDHDEFSDASARRANFDEIYQHCEWWHWEDLYQQWRPRMPLLLGYPDPDQSALHSRVNIVVETYVNDYAVTFSEKIFRALQTPRPWLLYCSHHSVDLLRRSGFDVLDDMVDHGYDHVTDDQQRMEALLDQVDLITLDRDRCHRAVLHNQQRLQALQQQWISKKP